VSPRAPTPKPWRQHELRTTFLRVPHGDWLGVRQGRKREFRASGNAASKVQWLKPPIPVVGYAIRPRDGAYLSQLMVLERCWREELRAISPESLELEGFSTFAEFRRYWKIRHNKPFRPLDRVWVYRVRPWVPGDELELGARMVERLYGEHMP
jgi:hypothetical protein